MIIGLQLPDPFRSYIRGSEGGPVPERYLVVRNDDLIRPRYLLVYADDAKKDRPTRRTRGAGENLSLSSVARSPVLRWLSENPLASVLLCYGLLLLAVGCSNSPWFWRFLRKRGLWFAE